MKRIVQGAVTLLSSVASDQAQAASFTMNSANHTVTFEDLNKGRRFNFDAAFGTLTPLSSLTPPERIVRRNRECEVYHSHLFAEEEKKKLLIL